MNARRLRPVLALVLACALAPAFAQDAAPATRTGDAWVDRQLDDINRYGANYRSAFVDELVRYHGAPRELVLDLLERGWPPGEVYYACALGTVAGRPCRQVVDRYTHGDGAGWQLIAQQIGVETDSAQFLRLRQGLVATYARWGRPIEAAPAPDARGRVPSRNDAPAPAPKPPIKPPPEPRKAGSER